MSKSTAVVTHLDTTKPEERKQMITVLANSLYPGAHEQSVSMVIDYCQAGGLDPLQKPVHIVPMSVKNAETGEYEYRDVIMPGIGLYRIQADRSGSYAGMSAPEFGPDITQTFTDKNNNKVEMTFPEWCEVTASKVLPGGKIATFTAREYWTENYATDKRGSTAPNAMWRKRPRGQIAKCAEAQALRKGWPEIGQSPTAEEMEGKEYYDMGPLDRGPDGSAEASTSTVQTPRRKSAAADESSGQTYDAEPEPEGTEKGSGENKAAPHDDGGARLNPGMVKVVQAKLNSTGVPENEMLKHFGAASVEELPAANVNEILAWISKAGA